MITTKHENCPGCKVIVQIVGKINVTKAYSDGNHGVSITTK